MDGLLLRPIASLLVCLLAATSCSGGCGGALTNPANGTAITSPNYPDKYPSSLNCRWDITVPAGWTVRLTLEDLVFESQANGCKYDYLVVTYSFDYPSPQNKICIIPEPNLRVMTSTGNKLVVQFITDSSLEEKGFKATIDTVEAPSLLGKKAVFAAGQGSLMTLSSPSPLPPRLSSFFLCANVRVAAGHPDWTLFTYSVLTDAPANSPALGLTGNGTALAFWLGGRATWAAWRRPHEVAWHRVCAGWAAGAGVSVFADGALVLNSGPATGDPGEVAGTGALLLGQFQTVTLADGANGWAAVGEQALVGELTDALLWAYGNDSLAQVPCQRGGSRAEWSREFWQPLAESMLVDAELPAARDVVDNYEVRFQAEVDAADSSVDEQLLATVVESWLSCMLQALPYSTELQNISFVTLDEGSVKEAQGSGAVTQAPGSASRRFTGTVHVTATGALDAVACHAGTALDEISRSLNSSRCVANGTGTGGARSRRASDNAQANGWGNSQSNNSQSNNGQGNGKAQRGDSQNVSVGGNSSTSGGSSTTVGSSSSNPETSPYNNNISSNSSQDISSYNNNISSNSSQDTSSYNNNNISSNSSQDTSSYNNNNISSNSSQDTSSYNNNSSSNNNSSINSQDNNPDNYNNSSTMSDNTHNTIGSNNSSMFNQTGNSTGTDADSAGNGMVGPTRQGSDGAARPELGARFTFSSVIDLAECQAEDRTTEHKGLYSWPRTRSPFTASLPCVQNAEQVATRTCDRVPFAASAQWLDQDVSSCQDIQVSCGAIAFISPNKGEYLWPPMEAGDTASVPCMQNPEKNATMLCYRAPHQIVAHWNAPNFSDCSVLSASCPNDTTVDVKKGAYEWPATQYSLNASVPCQQNAAQNATRRCYRAPYGTNASWLDPDLSGCVEVFVLFTSNVTMVFSTNNSQLDENTVRQNMTSWVQNDLSGKLNYTVDIKNISVTRSGPSRRRRDTTNNLWIFTVNMILEMKRLGMVNDTAAILNISRQIQQQLNSTIVVIKDNLERMPGVRVLELNIPPVGNGISCLDETLVNIKGSFKWPTVYVDSTATINCPSNTNQLVSRKCIKVSGYSAWEPVDTDVCTIPSVGDTTDMSASAVMEEMNGLQLLLDQSPTISVKGATMVADRFSSLLDAPASSLSNSSAKALHMVETLLQKIDFPNASISLPTKNVLLYVSKMNQSESPMPQAFMEGETSVTLPASLLDSLNPADKALATRAQFSIYNNTKLFPQTNLSSYVVAASVGTLTNITNLTDPVNITLWHTNQSVFNPTPGLIKNVKCVYWDLDKKEWNGEGCVAVPGSTDHNVTLCQCNHLTNFALLLDFSPGPKYSEAIEQSLSFLSYIGSGLSTIFLGITLVTYITFEKIRTDHPSKILMNLCAALLLLNLLFLLDAWIAWFNIYGLCLAMGALLHYSLLASFTWMGLEAVHLYLAVVKVFNTYVRNYILKFCIVGWGIPAVIVAILLAVNKDFYGKNTTNSTNLRERDDFCWIRSDPVFYAAVGGYFCLVFCLNISMFVVVLRQICQQKRKHGKDRNSSMARELRGTVSLTFLLGITWAFAFFGFGPQKLAFSYLFIIFNTLQGFMIFLFHCALRENVRYQWKKFFCCGKYTDNFVSETSKNRSTLLNRKQKQRLSRCSGTSHSTEQTDVTSLNNSGKAIG